MIDEMLKNAMRRRWSRTLSALALGTVIGAFAFCAVETGILAGLFLGTIVYIVESREVERLRKIQKPWRNG